MLDLIIKNGKVVTEDVTLETDIGINDGKIVCLSDISLMPKAKQTIDAKGKYVLPGGIDPHTHFEVQFGGATSKNNFYDGSRALAIGGTTTYIDFVQQNVGEMPIKGAMERIEQASPQSVIDFGLHMIIVDPTIEAIGNLKEVIEYGIPSMKCFMVYPGFMCDDAAILDVLAECKKYNGLFGAHAENPSMIARNIEKALRENHHDPIWHALTKPPIVEAEAINRALYLARSSSAAYYNYHMSCKEGVDLIRQARCEGAVAYAETCTHYLSVTMDLLKQADGINYIASPALRDSEHIDALWKGIEEGLIQTVGSDDASYDTKQKHINGDSFEKVPNGMAGCEFRMPIVFSEGVSKGRISVNQYASITSTNASKIFGLYPKKGIIAVGSDADITIIDPEIEKTVTLDDIQTGMDFSPYVGLKVKGWPVVTIANGEVIVENGEFKGKAGAGKFLKRELSKNINKKLLF